MLCRRKVDDHNTHVCVRALTRRYDRIRAGSMDRGEDDSMACGLAFGRKGTIFQHTVLPWLSDLQLKTFQFLKDDG